MRTERPSTERLLLAGTAVLAVLVPVLSAVDAALPGRTTLATLYVLAVPGYPLAVLLRLPDRVLTLALTIATSLAALLLVATVQVTSEWWSPTASATALSVSALALLPFALRSGPAHPREPAVRERGLAGRAALGVLVGALALWWWAVEDVDLEAMSTYGLISVVPLPYLGAVTLVAAVAGWALRRPRPDPLVLTACALSLIVILFGFLNVADSAASFRTAWVHVGFIDHISQYGERAEGYDARFSWPGFFAAGAVLVHLAGMPDAEPLLRWAPVVYQALAIPGLLVIGRVVGGDARTAWLGVLLYGCFNWFSQDYLAPQATVLLLYLAVLATLLATSVPPDPAGRGAVSRLLGGLRTVPPRPPWLSAPRALAVEVVLLLLCAAMVVSHQLTPVTLIGLLLAFAVAGATRFRQLWLLMALAFLGWFSFGAEDFWRGHLQQVFGDVGQVGSTLGSSVGARLQGNPEHGRMQQLRLLWSAAALGLGTIGLWLRRDDPRLLAFAAMALGPFGLLAVQSYGGEVLLRCFVYALPALAPLAALVVLRVLDRLPAARTTTPAVIAAALVLAAATLTATRGANASFERVTASQVRIARILLDAMPADSRIGLLGDAGPLGLMRLTEFEPVHLSPDLCEGDVVRCVRRERPDYLYVTASQDALGQLKFGEPPGWTRDVVAQLVRLRLYRRLATAPDAYVMARIGRAP